MKRHYRVYWSIDIDAESPKEAAEEALKIQRDPDSIATWFRVTNQATGEQVELDLLEGWIENVNQR